ncbi:MAG: N-acetylmuramoyl-L-alanine amidase [Elusimicrobia bacterium]|nr:N-acetylmuramoyl-L-alanine amidase [Elusimicrobiota bacterium]
MAIVVYAIVLSLLPVVALAGNLGDGLSQLTINNKPLAMSISLTAQDQDELKIIETGESDPPEQSYQEIFIQGTMPNDTTNLYVRFPGLTSRTSSWNQIRTLQKDNGRFWARFTMEQAGRSPINVRFVVRGKPLRDLIIYSVETVNETISEKGGGRVFSLDSLETMPSGLTLFLRSDWNAQQPKDDYAGNRPRRITLHHTAGKYSESLEESIEEMRFLQEFHQQARGWLDIGYHFIIDGKGRTFEGRPSGARGAHAAGHNTGNIGIALMGYYHEPINNRASVEQLESVARLIAWVSGAYSISPKTLKGHRDLNATACPGDTLYELLDPIRSRAAEIIPSPRRAKGLHFLFDRRPIKFP